jgi:hypothetical protein
MNTAQKQRNWDHRIAAFNEENIGRPTRLGVFERLEHGLNDYWLESGRSFKGVTVEDRNGKLAAEILLDGYAHLIHAAAKLELIYDIEGSEDGMNIHDTDGRTTILRFEEAA